MNKLSISIILLLVWQSASSQVISRSFEMRYITKNAKANGETDFKGPTEFFDTPKRLEYLKQYATYAKKYFNDALLDKKVVSDTEANYALRKIKPQPLPTVRKRLMLADWKYLSYKEGQIETEDQSLKKWQNTPGLAIKNEQLLFRKGFKLHQKITPQGWRFFLQFDIRFETEKPTASFDLTNDAGKAVCKIAFLNGKLFYYDGDKQQGGVTIKPKQVYTVKLEPDLESGKYNLYLDDQLIADFVSVSNIGSVNSFNLFCPVNTVIDNVWGVGYTKVNYTTNHTRDVPFGIKTFIDENFSSKPNTIGWQNLAYNDKKWQTTNLPYADGGERHADEDLYMRKSIRITDFKKAFLNIETIDPGGEIWINNQIIEVIHNRHPIMLDVSKYLRKNTDNLIAIKVYPNKVIHTNRHTPSDMNTGWFSGRAYLDLTSDKYITDVFTHTETIKPNAISQKVNISIKNEDWQFEERELSANREFHGFVSIKAYPWFPTESSQAVAEKKIAVNINVDREMELNEAIDIPDAKLWTTDSPNLYKIEVVLEDPKGNRVDDWVTTTGLRTISQDGGTFRINGEPAMMNGAMLFGYKAPLDKIAQWLRGGPDAEVMRELLMLKKLNGNSIRMSIHDGVDGASNDPRLAEYADQLGVMFQWTTGSWVRTGSPWNIDWEGLPQYIKQMRNHPSIVMWQIANHPKFNNFRTETYPWLKKLYNTIYDVDQSRLISPTANSSRMVYLNDEGTLSIDNKKIDPDSFKVWTAPQITRGGMDFLTGYSSDWRVIRSYPHPPNWSGEQGWISDAFRVDNLNSKSRAYFDFEGEESIGQNNWNLMKGKPMYRIMSYEINEYDNATIGRQLTLDEWELSQAWQAFSSFEAYKKKRWLDYDGMMWCTLDGGGNTGTYLKPLTDYYGHGKLAFHTIKMAFQNTLAGSHNVDMVYGPNDELKPVIMNLGEAKMVDVIVDVKNVDGKVLDEKTYKNVRLEAGRTVKDMKSFIPNISGEGFFVFEYTVEKASGKN
jgi:hypothetical protein